jgi:hypothetical protein
MASGAAGTVEGTQPTSLTTEVPGPIARAVRARYPATMQPPLTVLADLEDLVTRHRSHGRLSPAVGLPEANGYRLELAPLNGLAYAAFCRGVRKVRPGFLLARRAGSTLLA